MHCFLVSVGCRRVVRTLRDGLAIGGLVGALVAGGGLRPAQAQLLSAGSGPLVIDEAVPDAGSGTLTIAGANFGARPFVTLDLIPLDIQLAIDRRVIAIAPVGAMPPGTYQLTVSRGPGPTESASMDVAIKGGAPAAASAPPAVAVPTPSATAAAATVGDRTITVAEVDAEWQKTDPAGYLAVVRQLEDGRRRVANQMIADAVLAREAAARGTTVDALLKEELPKRTIAMPDSSVTSLYVSMGDRTRGASIEQMRPALRAWLAKHTEPELARMTYVEELMKTATRAEVALPTLQTAVEITPRDPVLGPASAAVTLVAFGDLQSNEYVRLAQVFGRVRETFGERLRIVFKHLPTFGGPSDGVAQAAACAHAQGRFWAFHDLAAKPGTLDETRLTALAADVGVDPRAFAACRTSPDTLDLSPRAVREAARYGITGSPAVLVNGRLAPDPPTFLPPFDFLKRLIEEELARQSRAAASPR